MILLVAGILFWILAIVLPPTSLHIGPLASLDQPERQSLPIVAGGASLVGGIMFLLAPPRRRRRRYFDEGESFSSLSPPTPPAAVNVPLITNDGRVLAEGRAVGIAALTPRALLERKGRIRLVTGSSVWPKPASNSKIGFDFEHLATSLFAFSATFEICRNDRICR